VAFLKKDDFSYAGREIKTEPAFCLPHGSYPLSCAHIFVDIYRPQDLYRATGIVLMELTKGCKYPVYPFEDALRRRRVQ